MKKSRPNPSYQWQMIYSLLHGVGTDGDVAKDILRYFNNIDPTCIILIAIDFRKCAIWCVQ